MSTIYMLVGIPGSGKSTYAKNHLVPQYHCSIVSSDVVRQLHPDWEESLVWPEVYRLLAEAILHHQDVIYDATSVTPKVRARFFERLKSLLPSQTSFRVEVYFFPTPWQICYQRIEKRNQQPGELFFPLEKVESYGSTLIAPTLEEGFSFIHTIKTYED